MPRYNRENNPEVWSPKEWHIRTKHWSAGTKEIAKQIAETPDDGRRIEQGEVDEFLKGGSYKDSDIRNIKLAKALSALPEEALYRMITSFSMSPCSVDLGILRHQSHSRIPRRRIFRGRLTKYLD